jgi:hypothetical protein
VLDDEQIKDTLDRCWGEDATRFVMAS